MSIKIWSL